MMIFADDTYKRKHVDKEARSQINFEDLKEKVLKGKQL